MSHLLKRLTPKQTLRLDDGRLYELFYLVDLKYLQRYETKISSFGISEKEKARLELLAYFAELTHLLHSGYEATNATIKNVQDVGKENASRTLHSILLGGSAAVLSKFLIDIFSIHPNATTASVMVASILGVGAAAVFYRFIRLEKIPYMEDLKQRIEFVIDRLVKIEGVDVRNHELVKKFEDYLATGVGQQRLTFFEAETQHLLCNFTLSLSTLPGAEAQ